MKHCSPRSTLFYVLTVLALSVDGFLVRQGTDGPATRAWSISKPQKEPASLSSSSTPQQQNVQKNPSTPSFRSIRKVEKFSRLPVWPVWNGVLVWIVSRILGNEIAAKLEDSITGRVCPNFYNYQDTSPFIMLVHHCHSFGQWDPLRYLQRTFFPEGFPAHPHRGFVTVTYILSGGFIHRDSQGVRQVYGAEPAKHSNKHTQWLMTGSGMLHEEMFDVQYQRQELYQLWLNVPSSHKMDPPDSVLLGGSDETPIVEDESSRTLVLAGTYRGHTSVAPALTKLALLHVILPPNGRWRFDDSSYETAFLYLRKGQLVCGEEIVGSHHTAYFDKPSSVASKTAIEVSTDQQGADFLFLAGEPIREPCQASGSMVMTNSLEIQQAYEDYNSGMFGIPWDHKLTDAEWKEHLQNTRRN